MYICIISILFESSRGSFLDMCKLRIQTCLSISVLQMENSEQRKMDHSTIKFKKQVNLQVKIIIYGQLECFICMVIIIVTIYFEITVSYINYTGVIPFVCFVFYPVYGYFKSIPCILFLLSYDPCIFISGLGSVC